MEARTGPFSTRGSTTGMCQAHLPLWVSLGAWELSDSWGNYWERWKWYLRKTWPHGVGIDGKGKDLYGDKSCLNGHLVRQLWKLWKWLGTWRTQKRGLEYRPVNMSENSTCYLIVNKNPGILKTKSDYYGREGWHIPVKCLRCNNKDLKEPQNSQKSLVQWSWPVTPALRARRKAEPWLSLVSQLSWIGRLQVQLATVPKE